MSRALKDAWRAEAWPEGGRVLIRHRQGVMTLYLEPFFPCNQAQMKALFGAVGMCEPRKAAFIGKSLVSWLRGAAEEAEWYGHEARKKRLASNLACAEGIARKKGWLED